MSVPFLSFHQQCMSNSVSLCTCQHLVLSLVFILAVLIGVNCCLIVLKKSGSHSYLWSLLMLSLFFTCLSCVLIYGKYWFMTFANFLNYFIIHFIFVSCVSDSSLLWIIKHFLGFMIIDLWYVIIILLYIVFLVWRHTHTHTHTHTHSQSTAINLPLPMKGKNFISVSVPLYLPLLKYLCFDISCYFKFYLYKYYLETWWK